MADRDGRWDEDDDWGKPLSQDPADVERRERGSRQMMDTTQRLLRWSYVVILILLVVLVWLGVR